MQRRQKNRARPKKLAPIYLQNLNSFLSLVSILKLVIFKQKFGWDLQAGFLSKFRNWSLLNINLRFNWDEQAMAVLLMPLTMFHYRLFKVTQSFKRWTIKHEPPPIFRGPFRSQSPPAKRHQFQHNQVNFLQSFFFGKLGEYFMDSCQKCHIWQEASVWFLCGQYHTRP